MATSATIPNEYTWRTATTSGSCFVCNKESTAVLTNESNDWFYVCLSHLSDASFCREKKTADALPLSAAPPPANPPSGSKAVPAATGTAPAAPAQAAPTAAQPAAAPIVPAGPKKVILTTNFHFLRENLMRKRAQAKTAKSVVSQMPSVPRRPPPS
ncbi:hypothetical protein BC831DRAFT_441778 [Entophlyctis helioformis]|nr:hypothetical protein BC831DRAFT_441778 [Entophlyctis helioformis]